ncbi:MAG: hypothetical protein QOJ69_18 [Actinomycetota bacterium]|nr:hypothetical protein [Actinomycetota bacterium]
MTTNRTPHRRALSIAATFAVLLALVVLPSGAASAQGSGFESIPAYDVDIAIESSGDIVVTEVIDYDFGAADRHGIFRNIPVRFHYDNRYDRIYPLDVISVQGSPGTPDQYEESTSGADKVLKIGDPKRTISGRHQYTIRYRVGGALNGFDEHDELYWNAIGDEWPVPIEKATVRVRAPGPIDDVTCFAGPTGANTPCNTAEKSGDVATFTAGPVDAYEGVTVVVGFPKGLVAAPTPVLDERWTFTRAFAVTPVTAGLSVAMLAGIVALVGALLWRTGRDRRYSGSHVDIAFGSETGTDQAVPLMERAITPVEFEPPDKLRPGQVGTLWDEVANPLDVTATIVDLAVRGYLRIDEIDKQGWFGKADWNLVKLKDGDKLKRYETILFDSLFSGRDQVKLSELKNTFASDLKKVQDALYDDTVEQGWFHARPDRTRTKWQVLAVLALIVAGGIAVLLAIFTHAGLLGVPLVVGALVLLWGAKRMPRRTAKGTGTLRRVQGFRRFIEESEKERARFAERQHLFSEYLPYAIVFGATEKWAKAFAGLDGQLPQTSWYTGSHGYFTAYAFSNTMDGFATTTSGTITSTP